MQSKETEKPIIRSDAFSQEKTKSYILLSTIFGLAVLSAGSVSPLTVQQWAFHGIRFFLAYLFIAMGALKLLDHKAFVAGFSSYDILAAKSRLYANVYPLIELILGLMYAFNLLPVPTSITALGVVGLGLLGINKSLKANKKITCLCYGRFIKLPMQKMRLYEDLVLLGLVCIMLVLLAT